MTLISSYPELPSKMHPLNRIPGSDAGPQLLLEHRALGQSCILGRTPTPAHEQAWLPALAPTQLLPSPTCPSHTSSLAQTTCLPPASRGKEAKCMCPARSQEQATSQR